MKLKNIPNILSVIRIILVAVFVYTAFCVSDTVALVVFLLAGATDVVDGYLARRNNWITDIGKILDPFADKLMQCTVLVCLCIKDIIPLWFVIPYFVKEVATLGAGLLVIKRRSVVVVSKWYGKAAVCLFYATIVLSVAFRDFFAENILMQVVVFMPAVIFALAAFFGYVKHYWVLKKEEVERGKIRDVIK
jgi:cardiolipin synthase